MIGLRHTGGNAKLYLQLLRRFEEDFSAFSPSMQAMLDAGDRDGAQRTAHTLKGLCATLGAMRVHDQAMALGLDGRGRVVVVGIADIENIFIVFLGDVWVAQLDL